jgi:hypothetical protein
MSITYKPIRCATAFGTPRRRHGIVHRIRHAEQARMGEHGAAWCVATWMCGGCSTDAVFVDDPESFGGICKRCEIAFSGAVVYRCHSADGHLLYIGSCVRWPSREALHRKQTPWWPEVARVDEVPHPDLPTARDAEKAAIKAEAPLYNKQHNVKRFCRDGYAYVPVTA